MTSVTSMRAVIYCVAALFLSACAAIKDNEKYAFSSGIYGVRSEDYSGKAYVLVNDDSLQVYTADKHGRYDTSRYQKLSLNNSSITGIRNRFARHTLDLDLVSLPLKFRPAQPGFPHQLNSTINGGLYLGRRSDIYRIRQKQTAIDAVQSTIDHFGFSLGLFAGLGSTPMNPSVSNNRIGVEYDGLVVPFGISALAAHNALTFGLALGYDYMPHNHRRVWIYHRKHWIGMAVGLNLN